MAKRSESAIRSFNEGKLTEEIASKSNPIFSKHA